MDNEITVMRADYEEKLEVQIRKIKKKFQLN